MFLITPNHCRQMGDKINHLFVNPFRMKQDTKMELKTMKPKIIKKDEMKLVGFVGNYNIPKIKDYWQIFAKYKNLIKKIQQKRMKLL